MEVKIIPASKRIGHVNLDDDTKKKLNVAAYCRVSTDLEEQETSYAAQVRHYTEYIYRNPEWAMAGIYADEGISGTGTKKREEFNRMIKDCLEGRIDMVITKSISRFARNTLDCLKYIRLLKEKEIAVFFEKENINTLDAKGEVLITIMASLAQQESQSISQNVRMGIRYQFQQGKVRVNHHWFLGYTKDAEGHLIVDPEEAVTVRRIYREFREGRSLREIARRLEADGIRTGSGRTKWYDSTVRSILTNEKYMGDALLQKNYTVDFLTRRKARNDGVLPQYYVENNHEAIISREVFQQVQGELQRRSQRYAESGMKEVYSSKFALSGKLVCGCCGSSYRRMNDRRHPERTAWRCKKRIQNASLCEGRAVNEQEVQQAILNVLAKAARSKKKMQSRTLELTSLFQQHYDPELDRLNKEIVALQEKLFRYSEIAQADRLEEELESEKDMAAVELERVQKLKRRLSAEKAELAAELEQLKRMLTYLETHDGSFVAFEDAKILPLLKKVRVLKGGYEIHLNTGMVAIEGG